MTRPDYDQVCWVCESPHHRPASCPHNIEPSQPSLLDAAPSPNVRPSDPPTSHAAAARDRATLAAAVRKALIAAGPDGATDWELTAALGLAERRKPSVAKRRQEAEAVDSGRTRLSPDEHACIVWVDRSFVAALAPSTEAGAA